MPMPIPIPKPSTPNSHLSQRTIKYLVNHSTSTNRPRPLRFHQSHSPTPSRRRLQQLRFPHYLIHDIHKRFLNINPRLRTDLTKPTSMPPRQLLPLLISHHSRRRRLIHLIPHQIQDRTRHRVRLRFFEPALHGLETRSVRNVVD